MRERLGILTIILLLMGSEFVAALYQSAPELPRVLVLATGGTIAGEQEEPGTLGPYEVRKTADEIVALVPEIANHARVETEQLMNVPSSNITPDHWLEIARRINAIFASRPDLSGMVVTHGTDRLTETAFFLHLTVMSDRPVVVTGAQRPPTGISPDGPLNLLSAVRVAASDEARGKGVMVVMDERILSARDTEKIYARTGGFDAPEMGMLGIVAPQGVEFFYAPTRRHTLSSDFDASAIARLPSVEVHYSYAGSEDTPKSEADGVVVAATALTPGELARYDNLHRHGVVVALTFPSGLQLVPQRPQPDRPPFVAVKHLLPLHARILLMLALTKTRDPMEIQKYFDVY